MTSMTPCRIAAAGDKTLRFYLSPLDGPDFPWIDFQDLLDLARLSQDSADLAKEHWSNKFPAMTRHLPSGVMIVPDICARGLFEWIRLGGYPWAEATGQMYAEAAAAVLASLYGDLPHTIMLDFIQKACLRHAPVEIGYAN